MRARRRARPGAVQGAETLLRPHKNSGVGLNVRTSTSPISEIRSSGITTSAMSECCM